MKSKEELNALKDEVASVNEKLHELTPEELEKVTGGAFSITRRGTVATGRIETGEAPSILT
ncbi:MAG: hypothetical protein Q4A04_07580 [Eubacteriales bacterium]|nr:hypothetical protein [Eubacteriales bacterium]